MKQTIIKKTLAGLLALTVGFMSLGSISLNANAEKVTEEESVGEFPEEITVSPVTIKLGQSWFVSSSNIDALISDVVANLNADVTYVYYPENPDGAYEWDEEYLSPVYIYEYIDAETYESYYTGYGTAEEMEEVYAQFDEEWLMEYEGKTVTLVESPVRYHVRAEKTGTTMLTIPAYRIGTGEDGTSVKLNIPIVIEENVITSSTDSNVVLIDDNGILPAGTTLSSQKVASGSVHDKAKVLITEEIDKLGNFAVYELNLLDASNVEIHQLDGKVRVTMDVPFEMKDGSVLKVYRIDDNGNLIECKATVNGGKVTFETDHFSTYIFAEQEKGATSPITGEGLSVIYLVTMLGAAGLLITMVVKKNKTV